jgi:hypothetical protein
MGPFRRFHGVCLVTEASKPSSQEPVDLKDPTMAGLLAWLVPGLGHCYQGRWAKAVLYFGSIIGLFVLGLYLSGGSYVDASGMEHKLGYGRAVYFAWRPADRRWHYICQFGAGLPALPALLQASRMNNHQKVWWGGFMAPPRPSADRRDNGNDPNADQPTRSDLDRWLARRFELGGVLAMIAGLLNVLAIYDACAGPVAPPAKKEDEEATSPV